MTYHLFKTPKYKGIRSVEATLLRSARKYFDENSFLEVVPPTIGRVTGACENIDTMFELDYFGKRGFLIQTGQLFLEPMLNVNDKVYCIVPSSRAEPGVDNRHLTQFTLVEFEFKGNFEQMLTHTERIVHSMIQGVVRKCEDELSALGRNMEELEAVERPFDRVTYTEAVEKLGIKFGDDLKSVDEQKLVALHGDKPLFVTHFPKLIKFFNMIEDESNPAVVKSADLLLPYSGEAVGSAERENNYEKLVERLKSSQMMQNLLKRGFTLEGALSEFEEYFGPIKEFGGFQHAGGGIGLNRVTQYIIGNSDIRTTSAYPLNSVSLY